MEGVLPLALLLEWADTGVCTGGAGFPAALLILYEPLREAPPLNDAIRALLALNEAPIVLFGVEGGMICFDESVLDIVYELVAPPEVAVLGGGGLDDGGGGSAKKLLLTLSFEGCWRASPFANSCLGGGSLLGGGGFEATDTACSDVTGGAL